MSNLLDSVQMPPEAVTFVDHRQVDWSQVRRTKYWMYQRFRYEYPGPVRQLRQRLIVVPARQHGDQHLREYKLSVSALATDCQYEEDSFGNQVIRYDIPSVDRDVDFEVWTSVERGVETGLLPRVTREEALRYLKPTKLTWTDPKLTSVSKELLRHYGGPWDLAERINKWAGEAIGYSGGVTNVMTTAGEALALGQGLCQDYSHIMLALCREVGLPARYVSGHLLGEGGSHAWVEVMLPIEGENQSRDLVAVAYDPTNRCRVGLSYITVAVGRDYSDVSPTSGSYIAPYQGQLVTSKRAGLTAVEYI